MSEVIEVTIGSDVIATVLPESAVDATTVAALAAEVTNRTTGDTTLATALAAEASTRAAADTALTTAVAAKADAAATTTALAGKADRSGPGATVPRNQLPNISGSFWQQVANQAAMLALTAPDADTALVVFRTDTPGTVWFLNPGLNPATLGNWGSYQDDAAGAAAAAQTAAQSFATSAIATQHTTDNGIYAPITTTTIDLVDRTNNTTETVPAGTTTNCSTAGVTKTAPALDNPVATPPKRFAVKNLSAGNITVAYPDQAGAGQSLVVLPAETRTFRQKSVSGWGVESGAVAVSTLDARFVALTDPGRAIVLTDAAYGAKCDGVILYTAVTSGNATISIPGIQSTDAGKTIIVDGAAAGGTAPALVTTIQSVNVGTHTVTLTATPTRSNASARVIYGTDDSAAWAAALTDWYNLNGYGHYGVITFPGVSLVDHLDIPNDGSAVQPWQPSLELRGAGAWSDGQWHGVLQPSGSVLVMTGQTAVGGKIRTRGRADFRLSGVTLVGAANDSVPLALTTNTRLLWEKFAMVGRPSLAGTSCLQDGIVLGGNGYTAAAAAITSGANVLTVGAGDPAFTAGMVGWYVSIPGAGAAGVTLTTTITGFTDSRHVTVAVNASTTVSAGAAYYFGVGNDPNAPFQGYGTKIKEYYADKIRRHVTFQTYANDNTVSDAVSSTTCGSGETLGAAYVFNPLPGQPCSGNRIRGGTIEGTSYPYCVAMLNDTYHTLIDAVGFWDAGGGTLGVVYCGSATTVTQNMIIAGESAGALDTNYVVGPGATLQTYLASAQTAASNLRAVNMFGNLGMGLPNGTAVLANISANGTAGGTATNSNRVTLDQQLTLLGSDNFLGPATNFADVGSLGTSDVWVDSRGSNTNINLKLRAKGTGTIQPQSDVVMASQKKIQFGLYTTTQRNAIGASSFGTGSHAYDTTLGAPIYSDGTNFRNYAGTIV